MYPFYTNYFSLLVPGDGILLFIENTIEPLD